jgi:hypothetical protein
VFRGLFNVPVTGHGSFHPILVRSLLVALVGVSSLAVAPASAVAPITLSGRLDVEHGDVISADPRNSRQVEYRVLDTGTERLTIEGKGTERLAPGSSVKLRGQRNGGRFVLAATDPVAATGTATAPLEDGSSAGSATPAVGTKHIAVLMANFTGDQRQPWTADQVRSVVFGEVSAASYWGEVSNGVMSITGDVFGYYTLAVPRSTCDYSGWMSAAKSAATAAGIVLADYTNVMLVLPRQSVCWWGGLGNVGGRNTWINGLLTVHVTSHELGHNFGVHHASALDCTDQAGVRVSMSYTCTATEYGDPYDVMGHGTRHTSNWHRRQLGFLGTSDQITITTSGSYRMATVEVSGGVPRVLRAQRPQGDFLYLEWRQPYGRFDAFLATSPAVKGVIIRIASGTARGRSRLIDTTPGTTSWVDAPLMTGRTFMDPTSGISITTTAVDATGATVQVIYGAVMPPPTPTPTPTPVPTATAPTPTATPIGTPIATPTQAPTAMPSPSPTPTPVPTATASPTPSPTPTPVPDTLVPTTPGALVATVTKNKASLSWVPSTDNSGHVSYQVFRDGVHVATSSSSAVMVTVRPGSHTFVVRAIDPSGNRSAVSAPATVVVDDWRGR